MKKMIFSAAAFAVVAVSTAVVAPTTSEAIPAFARQTGAACLSCHFQTFPTLSPMGRSFKEGAFTDVGEQGLIEDELLSITESLNFTMVLRPQFNSTTIDAAAAINADIAAGNAPGTTVAGTVSTYGIGDQVLMFGGRVGSNTGTFVEWDAADAGPSANFQLLSSWDMGDAKIGVDFWKAGFGETSGMEVGSTFGQHGGALNGKGVSASNILSGNAPGAMGGVTFFYANDMVNASVTALTDLADGATSMGWKFAPSARVFFHVESGDFEYGLGGGITSGSTGIGAAVVDMKKWMVDAQAQGSIGDMMVGIYADYAQAGASATNVFTGGLGKSDGYSIRANATVVHGVILGAGYGVMNDRAVAGGAAVKTKQWQVSGEYEIYQNFVVFATYNVTKVGNAETKSTTIDIEALL